MCSRDATNISTIANQRAAGNGVDQADVAGHRICFDDRWLAAARPHFPAQISSGGKQFCETECSGQRGRNFVSSCRNTRRHSTLSGTSTDVRRAAPSISVHAGRCPERSDCH
jgi:hypothetical protein